MRLLRVGREMIEIYKKTDCVFWKWLISWHLKEKLIRRKSHQSNEARR